MRNRRTTLLAVSLLAAAAAIGPAGTAAAHGDTIHFRIESAPQGHPRSVATWENDGDLVDEEIAATLSAVSADGRSLGPWGLVAVKGSPSTFSTREALPPGQWTVTVESGFPALGRGQAALTVDAAAPAAAQSGNPAPAGPPVPAAATRASASPIAAAASAPSSKRSAVVLWAIAAGAVAVLGTAGVLALRARRRAAR